jgi:hypothetical protein
MIFLGTLAGLLEHRHGLDAHGPAANAGRNAMQLFVSRGEGGIRTLGGCETSPVFKSRTSPLRDIRHKETPHSLLLISLAGREETRVLDPSGNGSD